MRVGGYGAKNHLATSVDVAGWGRAARNSTRDQGKALQNACDKKKAPRGDVQRMCGRGGKLDRRGREAKKQYIAGTKGPQHSCFHGTTGLPPKRQSPSV
jgi:hypothetical protein